MRFRTPPLPVPPGAKAGGALAGLSNVSPLLRPFSIAGAAFRPSSVPAVSKLASAPGAARAAILSAAGLPQAAMGSVAVRPGPGARPGDVAVRPGPGAGLGGVAVSIRAHRDHLSFDTPDFGDEVPDRPTLSYGEAFNQIRDSTATVRTTLQRDQDQLRQHAQGWNRFSLICAAVAFSLILLAAAALTFGKTAPGLVTMAVSVVVESAAGLFFVQARRVDARLDVMTQRLAESAEMYALFKMVDTIDDPALRDKLKTEIVRTALEMIKDRERAA